MLRARSSGAPQRRPMLLALVFGFVLVLVVAYVYIWRKGALEWR